jgi:precorrin-6A/cobalt-precorrin-6A reductase
MTLLILGGTREAHEVAAQVSRPAIVSLAHDLERRAYPVAVRRGGFGGLTAQSAWMVEAGISAVLDASHAFASVISSRTYGICNTLGLPCLRLLRPAWQAGPGDVWHEVASPEEVWVPDDAVVLLTAGAEHLDQFAGLKGHVICRSLVSDRVVPFARGEWLTGGPMSPAEECALMAARGVTHLVTRNSGGARGKLDAARDLGVRVILIARPLVPEGMPLVTTVKAAVTWVEGLR